MVVAQILRVRLGSRKKGSFWVRNSTSRVFRITVGASLGPLLSLQNCFGSLLFPFKPSQPGDIFYTTSVDGQPLSEESIEVPPGFDQATDGLTVPWAAVSNEGLVISEPATGTALRCLVGPREADKEDRDWLQFRSLEGAARHEVKGYEKG